MAIKQHHIDAVMRAVLAPEALGEWERRRIVCVPRPGSGRSIEYAPERHGLTHFG